MAKNLDGIKKLNSEEIKKNRKIVLSYIVEKDSKLTEEPKTSSLAASAFNKVDGIKINRIFNTKPKAENIPEKPESVRDNLISKQERINAEEAERRREKLRLKEKAEDEEIIIEKNKREEEAKRIKQEIKSAKIEAAVEKKIKRQKAIRFFKNNLNNKLREFFSVVKRNFVYKILYLIIFLAIGYLVFCLLVLRFKIDDGIVGKMARFLPAPAVVTSQGIINYHDFRDIKNNNYINLDLAEKKNSLAEWIILKNLSRKYGLPLNSSDEVFALAFAKDEDINQIGLSRIKKISELLKNIDDIEQLSKYADEYGDVIYYDSEGAIKKFGQAAFDSNANQISDIIFSDNGYYITQTVDNKNGRLGIKYLFVGAKTLDQYLSEKLSKIKIFILAN